MYIEFVLNSMYIQHLYPHSIEHIGGRHDLIAIFYSISLLDTCWNCMEHVVRQEIFQFACIGIYGAYLIDFFQSIPSKKAS